ncbi:hypothetical protein [Lentibacillus sediminis]|uniref:hypothetical protein n=1 Tax=Lentibacillus sediminis TaxID=1940529 RepID=UPI000C1C3B0B|nr:hypothetical protein [Lentibacillus sediminis]
MQTRRQVWELAVLELKNISIKAAFYFILISIFSSFILVTFSHIESNIAIDVIFIMLFLFYPSWMKAKEIQMQKISGDLWASPTFIMLNQLPISKDMLVKSRMLAYSISAVPFFILQLLILYIFGGGFAETIATGEYIAFSVIWISFSIYAGFIMPASDTGDRVNSLTMTVYTILLSGGALAFFWLFYNFTDRALVQLTVELAQNWPLLSSAASLLLAYLGVRYWLGYMKRHMEKIDYL